MCLLYVQCRHLAVSRAVSQGRQHDADWED